MLLFPGGGGGPLNPVGGGGGVRLFDKPGG
jgi:hypothetical protein